MNGGGPSRTGLLLASLLIILVSGCPGGSRQPRVTREVRTRSPQEREARENRFKENSYQRDQLFRHLERVRRGR